MKNKKGFSILMAIGIIAILMIVVAGLAMVYTREFKLSRLSYDEVIAKSSAEGVFEYGMLKIRNHRDGFSDSMTGGDIDGSLFLHHSTRSSTLTPSYTIQASSTGASFEVPPNEHLIVPLFTGSGDILSWNSKDPRKDNRIDKTQWLNITGIENLSWVIVAMSGSQAIGMSWSGNITPTSNGVVRMTTADCYYVSENGDTTQASSCEDPNYIAAQEDKKQEIRYFYDTTGKVADFLAMNGSRQFGSGPDNAQLKFSVEDAYIMIHNTNTNTGTIVMSALTPFALPTYTIESSAKNGDALQVFRFSEDRSRYYDALKYGVYSGE